jgi:hypothetical protein
MTGSIGGTWTARKRLEPSRPNGRGRIPLISSSVTAPAPEPDLGAGPGAARARGRSDPHPAQKPHRTVGADIIDHHVRAGRAGDRTGENSPDRRGASSLCSSGWPPCPFGACGVPVAESVLAPPGPIPNPVVTQRSAGEYCGGDPMGGEAAADTPHAREGKRIASCSRHNDTDAGWSSGSSLGS